MARRPALRHWVLRCPFARKVTFFFGIATNGMTEAVKLLPSLFPTASKTTSDTASGISHQDSRTPFGVTIWENYPSVR